ncbi:hypothetical protein F0L68_05460 [Solihabitans fulvus]|uniref:Peptidase inhibitor family I36 n=1 Tax=Solihabitans fulvus TaxID=1892852 RepID=A0A5B2XMM1_9PSEU|nr:peptidase inhibitor family I36 protein [Solihabitans fulvus]KAA2265108.1 hypothetical protein F0L68_05460 [Solihabitans fulvus]
MQLLRRCATALVVLLAVVVGSATANAEMTNSAASRPVMIAQAHRAGLTDAQIADLQGKVDAYVASSGGRQVASNKVAFDGGEILFVATGEKYVRELGSTFAPTAASACPYHYFCAWHWNTFSGDEIKMYTCNKMYPNPWWEPSGSWINNETPGVRAYMFDYHRTRIYTTPPAYWGQADADWSPVSYTMPC